MASPIRRRRFYSEDEILVAIDGTKAKVMRLRDQAYVCETKADQCLKRYNTSLKQMFLVRRKGYLERAERKRDLASNIENNVLPKLKARLAVFRTLLLPEIGFNDRSIPL